MWKSSDFVDSIVSCQFIDQFSTMRSAVWSFEGLQDGKIILMSSEYTNRLTSSTATSLMMKSSMRNKKRREPIAEPWRAPLVTWLEVNKDLSTSLLDSTW